jgi:hypothetical protein
VLTAVCFVVWSNLLLFSAIEDELAPNVPRTLAHLLRAGLKVWVLTGDTGSCIPPIETHRFTANVRVQGRWAANAHGMFPLLVCACDLFVSLCSLPTVTTATNIAIACNLLDAEMSNDGRLFTFEREVSAGSGCFDAM